MRGIEKYGRTRPAACPARYVPDSSVRQIDRRIGEHHAVLPVHGYDVGGTYDYLLLGFVETLHVRDAPVLAGSEDCPDLGPVLMVLGLLCEGTTVIRNAERLRLKESDRIAAMEAELRACGGVLESEGGTITVHGCAERLHAPAAPLHGHNDHRVVMSLAVLALSTGIPLTVDDAEAITKSWPNFFEAIKPLGAEVEYAG